MERKQGRKCPQCDAANTRVIDGGSTLFCPACDYEEPRADRTPSPGARRTIDAVEVARELARLWTQADTAAKFLANSQRPRLAKGAPREFARCSAIEDAARAAGVEREFHAILTGDATREVGR